MGYGIRVQVIIPKGSSTLKTKSCSSCCDREKIKSTLKSKDLAWSLTIFESSLMVSIMLVVVFVHSPHNYVWVKVVKTFIDFLTSLVGKYYMRDQVPCNSSNTLLRCRPDQTRLSQARTD